ncbi:DUF2779 domain-containing protein [Sulfurimonas hydrogeniphila]|uniref:DUF2779 domain-containing protein n=1 Tax=Sulfurimonas hydrogeniphila TaxID=2509341 RepID=UPI00125EF680|nr:DUF2779 domain-containing protein [Sulfurimonas hydrogeniphila]
MTLSKSQYIRGLQCHKFLWLYKHKPELRDTPDKAQESLFDKGYEVGDLAKELFPNGVEIEFDNFNFNRMMEKTQEHIDNGAKVIYEAAFSAGGVFAMADILVKNGDAWDIYEVKGSTEVKDYYIDDASVQWYALSQTISLKNAYIVHINNNYVRDGALDVQKLFTIVNITQEVLQKQSDVLKNLQIYEQMLENQMPAIDIGKHCSSPNQCDFISYCWAHIPKKNSVFDLSYAMGKQWKLYEQGILSIDDIPDDFHLGSNASLQVQHHKSQKIKIDKPKIKEFLDTIEYPINFFDFETFQNAIPRFDNQRPYAQMPFQYSLHILHENGKLEHKEFLGDENSDPRRALSEQMLKDITPTGSIIAFNQSFEITQIKNLALLFPDLSDKLLALNERFIDLAYPFQHKHYYHPKFNGKYSIKVVLPTLFPDDDELDYKKLGSIQNGGDAMDTFANLYLLKDKNQLAEIKKDLLAYCRLDTLAMVRIWEKLHNLIGDKHE